MFEELFLVPVDKLRYLPCCGLFPAKINTYNEFINDKAKVYFEIFKKHNIEFYLFAGSAIGLVRGGKNIPWIDDFDIIIFEDAIEKFEKDIVPELKLNDFNIVPVGGEFKGAGYYTLSFDNKYQTDMIGKRSFFQCDVFFSKIDKDGYVRNVSGWGLYDKKDVPVKYVRPACCYHFEGMYLPFFHKSVEDVELEYGDVHNLCIIPIEHGGGGSIKIEGPWKDTHAKFYELKDQALKNSWKYINIQDYDGSEELVLDDDFEGLSILDLLKYLSEHNIGKVTITCEKYVRYTCSMRFFFPDINIVFVVSKPLKSGSLSFFTYLDVVELLEQELLDYYENPQIIYLKKPEFRRSDG